MLAWAMSTKRRLTVRQQTSMPPSSGLLPCPVERVRSAGQKAPLAGISSTKDGYHEDCSKEPGGHGAAAKTPPGALVRLLRRSAVD